MSEPPKKYSLSGSSSARPATPAGAPRAAAPVNPSTFLTRIANTAVREQAGTAPTQQGSPKFMASSIDHSSPAANLSSRLRWVETAFKPENQLPPMPGQQQVRLSGQQQRSSQQMVANAGNFRNAVDLMRKRMMVLKAEIDALDKELEEIQAKMDSVMQQQEGQQ